MLVAMDEQIRSLDRGRQARRYLLARRRRIGELRRRTLFYCVTGFVVVWLLVFGMMASGHDPVLDRGRRTSTASSSHAKPESQPERSRPTRATELVVDPATGLIVRVPVQGSAPPPAPSPPPVVTSSS